MVLVCYILAFVNFKMRVERIKGGKLLSFISWLIIIVFGCLHFFDIGFIQGDSGESSFLDIMLLSKPYTPDIFNISLLIIEGIILLVINLLTIENKLKAIIFTLSQLGISVVVIAAVLLLIVGLFFGGGSALSGKSSGHMSDEGSYTYDQNQAARNIGYSNGKDAEMHGKQWNGQSWQ